MKSATIALVALALLSFTTRADNLFPELMSAEKIKNRALLSLSLQRPDIKPHDLNLTSIDVKYLYPHHSYYAQPDRPSRPYASVLFYIISSRKKGPPIESSQRYYDEYKTIEVVVSPEIPPEKAAINESTMMTSFPAATNTAEQGAAANP